MPEITIWYLQSTSAEQLQPVARPAGIEVHEAQVQQFQFNRFLYQLVGGPWQWTDKLVWTDEQWRDYAERPCIRTWAAWVEGSPAGYFELEKRDDGSIEICYFGLAEKFIGRGFGSYLLSECISEAWQWGATRVTVNTCSLDHPAALDNYQSRGFELYETEVKKA
ncbi:MAG: GNAT family N-acetyltransferase [Halieaceae bacterium]